MIIAGFLTGQMILIWVCGLAFLGVGLAMSLEAGRSSRLGEARLFWLLALFGWLYGLYEMLEVWALQESALGTELTSWVIWIRWGLLVVSFTALLIYGVLGWQLVPRWAYLRRYAGAACLGLGVVVLLVAWLGGQDWLIRMEGRAHAALALLGGVAAGLALYFQAHKFRAEGRLSLATDLFLVAYGFGLYGLAQFFGTALAQLWLAGLFISVIQAVLAGMIAVGLIGAIRVVDREREQLLREAQQARQKAMELLQQEQTRQKVERQQLIRQTIIAQEDERARIARELHDETAQILTAFTLHLAAIKSSATGDPGIGELCNRLQDLSRQMSQSLYRLVHDLRPAQLDDLGLIAALQYLSGEVKRSFGLDARLKVTGPRLALDPLVETVIFRVTQEALTNIARHSTMDQAMVELNYDNGDVTLRVRDEGVGFDPQKNFTPPHGLGLMGMRERVTAVGGQFRLDSFPMEGTLVEAVIPIQKPTGSPREKA